MTAEELRSFEREVADAFEAGKIRAPVHLSGGNEEQLISIFRGIRRADWVFCSYRSHYHALLHGVPRETVMAAIMAGRSMTMCFPEHRFFTSAIVAGHVPMAVGVAEVIKRMTLKDDYRVWCFVGDMAACSGIVHEAWEYARGHGLPFRIIIENNGMSAHSPTRQCWGNEQLGAATIAYEYTLPWPHVNTGKWVNF